MTLELAGKRVVVAGLGLFGGGLGAARWALSQGARVTVTDLRDAEVLAPALAELGEEPGQDRLSLTLGSHAERDFQCADLIVLNPGVPPSAPVMAMAAASPGRVTTAMALTLGLAECRIAAITGTHGKSSTATFLAQVLRQTGRRVELGGNIGGSLLQTVPTLAHEDVLVLELSSYQLHHLPRELTAVIDLAAITNIGADHLAWHGSIEAYGEAKHRIWSLVRPGGVALVPEGLEGAVRPRLAQGIQIIPHGPGAEAGVASGGREFRLGSTVLGRLRDLGVPGDFQQDNAACALAAGHLLGTPAADCAEAVGMLEGLPHRNQPLGHWTADSTTDGAGSFRVIDNGISTTPESTLAAMVSLDRATPRRSRQESDPRPQKVLLAGGAPKPGLDFGALARYAAEHGWLVAPFGRANAEIRLALDEYGAQAVGSSKGEPRPDAETGENSLEDVWQKALNCLEEGAIVLFSPACASFDAFPNFRSRAVAFQACLRASATERKDTRD